jgi:hypothetical protein
MTIFKVLHHSVSELRDMALLLPFYILKIRIYLSCTGTISIHSGKASPYSATISGVVKIFSNSIKVLLVSPATSAAYPSESRPCS